MKVATYRVGGWPNPECTIRVVSSPADLALLSDWLTASSDEYLGIDCETNARDPFEMGFQTRLVQMADMHNTWVIPVRIDPERLSAQVKRHKRWVAHFAENDERFLARGLPGQPVNWGSIDPHFSDTQAVLGVYDPRTVTTMSKKDRIHPRIPRRKGLKETTTRLLTPTLAAAEDALVARFRELAQATPGVRANMAIKALKAWGFEHIDENDPAYQLYAALDPLCGIRAFHLMREDLVRRGQWDRTLAAMAEQWLVDHGTYQGMQVDAPYTRWLDGQLAAVVDGHTPLLAEHGIAPSGQGPNVGKAYRALGVTSPKVDEDGKESWDKEALNALIVKADEHLDAVAASIDVLPERTALIGQVRNLTRAVLDVRKAGKYRSTWVAPMLWTVDHADGAMHPSIRALGTVTSRMSCQKSTTAGPLHSAPKHDTRLRAGVRAERGWVLLSADFSQAEPFVMAGLSGDPDYLHDLQRGDINSILATQVYGGAYVAAEGKTGGTSSYLMRQRCKFAWLAWCYGAGDRKVDTLLGVHTGVVDTWRARYPVFARYRDAVNAEQVVTLDSGLRVPLWDRVWVDEHGELQQRTDRAGRLLPSRLGLNGATQGTQADLLKLSMHRLLHWRWSWAMRFFLHDELLLCVPEWMQHHAVAALEEAMTVRFRGVTIKCEVTIEGRTWQPQPTEFNPADIPDVEDDDYAAA